MRNFEARDLLFIDKMITPTIINIIYWVICVITIIVGIIFIFKSPLFILVIPFSLLGTRISCEMMVVQFKISNNIDRIVSIAEGKESTKMFDGE